MFGSIYFGSIYGTAHIGYSSSDLLLRLRDNPRVHKRCSALHGRRHDSLTRSTGALFATKASPSPSPTLPFPTERAVSPFEPLLLSSHVNPPPDTLTLFLSPYFRHFTFFYEAPPFSRNSLCYLFSCFHLVPVRRSLTFHYHRLRRSPHRTPHRDVRGNLHRRNPTPVVKT